METEKKVLTFRGKKLEELQALGVREVAPYLRSRQRRTVLRHFQDIETFLARSRKKVERGKRVKTHNRSLIVVPQMVGMKISIYNGREFVPVDITLPMIGHTFGEFSPTRKKAGHTKTGPGGKGKKEKKKK